MLLEEGDLLNKTKASNRKRERMKDRIKRLEAFQDIAAKVASELRVQLEQADLPKGES